MPTELTSDDLLNELHALEQMLENASIEPRVLTIRNAIATKRTELYEQQQRESQASTERQAIEDQAMLEALEREKDGAWALVQALRLELTEVQKRLAKAEFAFGMALRARGEALRAHGKGN